MGLFDKIKLGKKQEAKPKATPAHAKAEAPRTVVAPDGKLVATTQKEKPVKAKAKISKEETGEAYRVLIYPLISEKGSMLTMGNQYVFRVARKTNKIEVRQAIKKVYGVDPVRVNIINVRGKQVRYGRTEGRTQNWKKAIITLAAGQKINIQEGL